MKNYCQTSGYKTIEKAVNLRAQWSLCRLLVIFRYCCTLTKRCGIVQGSNCRAVGAGPAGVAVTGPILKMAPGATHGKRASRKLCLGYIKKAADCRIHATSLQECTRNYLRRSKHSKNFRWSMPPEFRYP